MSAAEKLRALYQREDMAIHQIAAIRARIVAAQAAYAKEQGYRVIPRPESLRREVGA